MNPDLVFPFLLAIFIVCWLIWFVTKDESD